MPAPQDLFISEQHPVSRRWAVIEDDGRVAWLYLTEPDTRMPAADCWLYNRVTTPHQSENVRGQPPVVPLTHAGIGATLQPPAGESVHLRWSHDGESVAVFFDDELIGFIAHGQKCGFSKHIRVSGPLEACWTQSFSRECFEESLHGFVTVHWDHETSEALESRLQPAQAVRAA